MNEQSIKEVEDRIGEVVDGLLDDIEEGQKRGTWRPSADNKMAYASKLIKVLKLLARIDPV
tara:strand:- start:271 stop:453 length:183 start_codon:yes stop_codon:yes gene_type:complete